jgi:hypothetical protein
MKQPVSDFDGAWKYALERYFAPFLQFFFPDAYDAIDWSEPVVFRDTDLQQIAPEDREGKQRVDKLAAVTRRDGSPALVLIHVEIQSQHDAVFAERMFFYHARILDRERVPVVSLAVLGDDDPAWRPSAFASDLWGCSLSLRFPTIKLLDLDPADLETLRNPFATLTLIHRDGLETRGKPAERLQRKVARFRTLLGLGYDAEDVRALLRLIEHILRLDRVRAQQARDRMRVVEQEVTGMDTFVTSFEELAREEERQAIVLRQLNRKVGPLPEVLQTRVASLAPEVLLTLSEDLLDFADQRDLVAWLDDHPSEGV